MSLYGTLRRFLDLESPKIRFKFGKPSNDLLDLEFFPEVFHTHITP